MTDHGKLLEQGPRAAPEPETAEERSKRLGMRSGAGVAIAGGAAALKFGGLAKLVVWLVAWHGVLNAWRLGSWVGIAIVLCVLALLFVRHARRGG